MMASEDKAMGEFELYDYLSLGEVMRECCEAPTKRTVGAQEAG